MAMLLPLSSDSILLVVHLFGRGCVRLMEAPDHDLELRIASMIASVLRAVHGSERHFSGVIVESSPECRAALLHVLPFLRRELGGVPLVAHCETGTTFSTASSASDNRELAAFAVDSPDKSGIAIRVAISSLVCESPADVVYEAVRPYIPARLHRFVAFCLSHPTDARTISGIALHLGVHRKTLASHARATNSLDPSELLGWLRLLLAARMLEASPRTVEDVSVALGWPSATCLRNMMKRYTGLRATDVRRRGGMHVVLTAFLDRLVAASRASLAPAEMPPAVARS